MWERKKHSALKRIDSLIGAGTVVHGDVTFTGGLRIDSHVHGNVIAAEGEPGTLVVSAQARIEGEIRVSHVVINGSVTAIPEPASPWVGGIGALLLLRRRLALESHKQETDYNQHSE